MPHPGKQIPASISAVLSYKRKSCFMFLFFRGKKKRQEKAANAKKIIHWFAQCFPCERKNLDKAKLFISTIMSNVMYTKIIY